MHPYVVVALLEPLRVGDEFPASRWPLHVTLSTNVDLPTGPEDAAAAVAEIASATPGFELTAEADAMFGARGTTRVTLVGPHDRLRALHDALVARLLADGAVLLYPAHVGDGYRPHATVQASGRLRPGQRVHLDRIALVDRAPDGDRAMRRVLSMPALAGRCS